MKAGRALLLAVLLMTTSGCIPGVVWIESSTSSVDQSNPLYAVGIEHVQYGPNGERIYVPANLSRSQRVSEGFK